MTDHEPARTSATARSRAAVENDEAKAAAHDPAARSADPVEDNAVIAAVTEGSAPSYDSGALTIDEETGAPVLQPASLPQLTMPELQGLDDPVVPETGDPALYGIDEEADEDTRTVAAVQRGKDVAEANLAATTGESRTGKSAARKTAKDKEAEKEDTASKK